MILTERQQRALEQATTDDAAWFAEHPGANRRTRPAYAGELGPCPIPAGALVEVVQIVPGIRYRTLMRELVGDSA